MPDVVREIAVIIHSVNVEPVRFVTPEYFLTNASKPFQSACWNVNHTTEPTRVIDLYGVKPGIYACYLMWVLREIVAVPGNYDRIGESGTERVCGDLTKLWLLANGLEDHRCQNNVMDTILSFLRKHACPKGTLLFSSSSTTSIWSATTSESPLRRIVLDYFFAYALSHQVRPHVTEYHPGFLRDLSSMTPRSSDLDPLQIATPFEAVRAEKYL